MSLAALQDRIRLAAERRTPLELRGGGSKRFFGNAPRGEVLDTRIHAGITDYEPSELVLTARCGTPLAEVEQALAANGQCLAFEPPHFGAATFGGWNGALRRGRGGLQIEKVTGGKVKSEPGPPMTLGAAGRGRGPSDRVVSGM